jgi:hypothetical protein
MAAKIVFFTIGCWLLAISFLFVASNYYPNKDLDYSSLFGCLGARPSETSSHFAANHPIPSPETFSRAAKPAPEPSNENGNRSRIRLPSFQPCRAVFATATVLHNHHDSL